MTLIRKSIDVTGIVQGVGFRPYIYRLATQRHLVGFITNTPSGVTIEIQGPAAQVEDFLACLPAEAPPLARVTGVSVCDAGVNSDTSFQILPSRAGAEQRALISPDVAVCHDCLRELFDPADRRYRYPFINCTNCGPRFTIIRGIPYDRPLTSMAVFPMCPECQREYDDPANRRFHAQPNACPVCGPRVELWDRQGNTLAHGDPVAEAVSRLREGAVVAVKGLGGFHLACDAANADAVSRLRERKRRVEKPFAIMAPDLATIEQFCVLDPASRALLLSPERPIVLLPRREPSLIVEGVAPFQHSLGVFLPYTPLHHLLFLEHPFTALVMTSGNLSEEPIAIDNAEAVRRLHDIADCFLVHNRDILLRCDDSVVRVTSERPRQWRRSRGFVPVPVSLGEELPRILAVGGELKNTICLTKDREAFLSQHVGDLENLETYHFFEEAMEHLQRVLDIEPRILAYDLHPDYFSTRWALARHGIELVGVQHHHAHIASCMAENHLQGRVIGIALDGTGFGSDGRIWGGEILLAGYADFTRAAHLAYVPLPGGDFAIREPWRMAVSYLFQHFGRDFLRWELPFRAHLDLRAMQIILVMIERGVNTVLTSSCGRLFDAVSALIGIRQHVNYEAQAAIELEAAIARSPDESFAYPFALIEGDGPLQIDSKPMFEALLHDIRADVPAGVLSRRFHNGLVEILAAVCLRLRAAEGLNRVCLSGGTFQNVYLFEHLDARLRESGFEVFSHSEVPAGDGGLSLGQALVAAHRLRG